MTFMRTGVAQKQTESEKDLALCDKRGRGTEETKILMIELTEKGMKREE